MMMMMMMKMMMMIKMMMKMKMKMMMMMMMMMTIATALLRVASLCLRRTGSGASDLGFWIKLSQHCRLTYIIIISSSFSSSSSSSSSVSSNSIIFFAVSCVLSSLTRPFHSCRKPFTGMGNVGA
jgi:hypothetical protein